MYCFESTDNLVYSEVCRYKLASASKASPIPGSRSRQALNSAPASSNRCSSLRARPLPSRARSESGAIRSASEKISRAGSGVL